MDTDPLLPRAIPRAQRRAAADTGSVPRYGTMTAEQPSVAGHIITSFLLSDIHCPSCVSSIKDALDEACGSDLVWVSPNIVTSVVTVEHRSTDGSASHAIRAMAKALDLAGYEVCSVTTTAATSTSGDTDANPDSFLTATEDHATSATTAQNDAYSRSSGSYNNGALERLLRVPGLRRVSGLAPDRRLQAHLANCEECRNSRPSSAHGFRDSSETSVAKKPDADRKRLGATDATDASEAAPPLEGITVDESGNDTGKDSSGHWRATLSIGGMTCASCVRSIEDGLNSNPSISKVTVNLVNNSATVDFTGEIGSHDVIEAIEDLGYEATVNEVVDLDQEHKAPEKTAKKWRATLSIGGMTCASCVNSVTSELEKKEWITDVAVNLVSNSATVDFTEEDKGKDIADAIEDIGYDAHLDTVVSLDTGESDRVQERTVQIHVDGIFCKHCPDRITHSLAAFQPNLKILLSPNVEHPYLTVRYVPNAPAFTIRRILDAIEAADPAFRVSIYHPPTLEERSKVLAKNHQRQLLRRVYLCFLIAIPTFVIGIVYMNLVPDGDHGKHFLMEPWTSGISRAQIALFILSTPVYFFATDVFHMRAAKELKNLWRRGSKTPIAKRFYKFGSMNLLISLGTTIAYVSSVAQMIAAAILKPDEVRDSHFYFDSVVFLTFFLLIGRVIEAYSKAKTGDAVEMLGKLRPTTAILVEKDSLGKTCDSVVSVDLVECNDVVRVPHGSSPVADGVLVSGNDTSSNFDESSLTGESRPIRKSIGDSLFAGTVNKGGAVLMRVTGAAGRSMLDQIVQVVREGQTKRAPMERVADLLTAYFVPIITLIAVLTWAVWTILGLVGVLPDGYLEDEDNPPSGSKSGREAWVVFALQFAISVFVVACPCGLGLAAPTAIFVGGGLAAKHGILAKGGGEAFEKASGVDVVVFDKTGTLTVGGDPKITDSVAYPDESAEPTGNENDVIALVAALRAVEENSTHPVARAIVSYCASVTDRRAEVDGVEEIPGRGMKATCRAGGPGKSSFDMVVGNEMMIRDFGVPVSSSVAAQLENWKAEAKSVALVGTRARADTSRRWLLAAALSVSDPVRGEAVDVVRALRAAGTDVWMLSGDNVVTARAVASKVGIKPDNVIAEVLPSEKADKIGYLQATLKKSGRQVDGFNRQSRGSKASRAMASTDGAAEGEYEEEREGYEYTAQRATVAMVGDGINDSPALTRADVGVAVGSGSDVAISSADFVLVSNDLRSVATLLELSRAVFRRIRLNFAWAIVYNVLAIPVAAGCFYGLTTAGGRHVKLDPVWAALAMALSSISVVLSSLALRTRVPWVGFRGGRLAGEGGK